MNVQRADELFLLTRDFSPKNANMAPLFRNPGYVANVCETISIIVNSHGNVYIRMTLRQCPVVGFHVVQLFFFAALVLAILILSLDHPREMFD